MNESDHHPKPPRPGCEIMPEPLLQPMQPGESWEAVRRRDDEQLARDRGIKPPLPGCPVCFGEVPAGSGMTLGVVTYHMGCAPPNPNPYAPLAARLREMAEDYAAATAMQIWLGPTRENKAAMLALIQKYWPETKSAMLPSTNGYARDRVWNHLKTAADLAKLLPEDAE